MNLKNPVRRGLCSVLIIMGVVASVSTAAAQSAVGTGPLTATLTDTEPQTGVLTMGPVKVAPGVTVQQLGWDDNVFDQPATESPKEDYMAEVQPDISAFSQLRFVRFSVYAGSPITYYQKSESERSIGYDARGRVDFLLSRVRPFFGYGETRSRTRPNGEIDIRPNRVEKEASGGLAFDISPHAVIYAAAFQVRHKFDNAVQDGVNLADTLTRDNYNYEGGVRTDLTPLLSMQLSGGYHEDRFPADPMRNSLGKAGTATFRFATEAVVSGILSVSYHDIHYSDPGLRPFRGVLGNVALTYPFFEVGRFSISGGRSVEYSFDSVEAYYLQNTGTLSYTHRLFGEVDVQGKVTRSLFDYSARPTQPAHKDTLDTASGSLGYNLRNRTRISLNYEYARRRSPAFSVRNYQRRRVFLSWLFAF